MRSGSRTTLAAAAALLLLAFLAWLFLRPQPGDTALPLPIASETRSSPDLMPAVLPETTAEAVPIGATESTVAAASCVVSGRLRMPDDVAIGGVARLSFRSEGDVVEVTPDEMGRYRVELPLATYEVLGALHDLPLTALSPPRLELTHEELAQDLTWDGPTGVVRGRVVDCDGHPVAHASVHVKGDASLRATSRADGRFEIAYLRSNRDYRLDVDPASLSAGLQTPWWQHIRAEGMLGRAHLFEAQDALTLQQQLPADLELMSGEGLTGVVRLGDGTPYADGTVSLRRLNALQQDEGPNYVFRTDPAGSFALADISHGTYRVALFSTPSGERRPDPIQVNIACRARAPLLIQFPSTSHTGSVFGVVLDDDRSPVEEARFGLWPTNAEGHRLGLAAASAKSDPQGRFRIDGLKDGTYELARSAPPLLPGQLEILVDLRPTVPVVIENGQGFGPIEWMVERAATVAVSGVMAMPGATPEVLKELTFELEVTTPGGIVTIYRLPVDRGTGRFELDSVHAGEARVLAYRWNRPRSEAVAIGSFSLVPGADNTFTVGEAR